MILRHNALTARRSLHLEIQDGREISRQYLARRTVVTEAAALPKAAYAASRYRLWKYSARLISP